MDRFFNNSIWYVPKRTLLAYKFINNVPIPVEDQTVWVIDKYDKGYIWGIAYTAINNKPVSKLNFNGSIAKDGKVLINFSGITGIGEFNGEKFIMQMNNLADLSGINLVISHWSYMKKTDRKSKSYYHLPGVGISVPEFIKLFD